MMATTKQKAAVLALAVPLVAGFEGLRTEAYRDPVGIPTICFGETRGVKLDDIATPEECRAMLGDRLSGFAQELDACLPGDLPPQIQAAFLSLAYNVGSAKVCRSSIPAKLRAGRWRAACDTLLDFKNPVWLPGILKRRQAERDVCLQGVAS